MVSLFSTSLHVAYWLSSQETDTANRVEILDEALWVSYSTNILKKGMNPTILPTSNYSDIVGQTRLSNFGMTTNQGKGKL